MTLQEAGLIVMLCEKVTRLQLEARNYKSLARSRLKALDRAGS